MVAKSINYGLACLSRLFLAMIFCAAVPAKAADDTSNSATSSQAIRLPTFPMFGQATQIAMQGDVLASRIEKPRNSKVETWNSLISDIQAPVASGALQNRATATALLEQVNRFWNRRIFFATDIRHFNHADVWTTPFETLAEESGDCEDFAIAKFFTLLRAGVPEQQLGLTLGFYAPTGEAHITLSVTLENGETLVLDNLNSAVMPASERKDLSRVLTMNRQVLSVYKAEYLQAGQDLASRFSVMNSRYVRQLTEWTSTTAVAASNNALSATF